MSLRLGSIDKGVVKEMLGFSMFVLILGITGMLMWNIPTFCAGWLYGAQAVTTISLPLMLLGQIQRISMGFGSTLIPVAGKFEASEESELLRVLATRGTKFCALMCFPVGIIAVIYSQPLFEWFKDGFGWTWALLAILIVPRLMRITQATAASVLIGAKSIRKLALGQIGVVAVTSLLVLLFAKYFAMGLHGIMLGTALPLFFFSSFFQTQYVCKQIGLKWLSYMHESYTYVLLCLIPSIAVALLLIRFAYPNGLVMISIQALACLMIFAVCAWPIALTSGERKQILAVFRRKGSMQVGNGFEHNSTIERRNR
jgi:O-antigen/teichoic acid export membrane protein